MISIDAIAQIGITIFGVAAILLVAKKNKWGFVMGLISQPFWLMTSYLNKQWGVFFLSAVLHLFGHTGYTIGLIRKNKL